MTLFLNIFGDSFTEYEEVIMKKSILILVLCAGITGISAFAFEAKDLLTYPSAVPAGSFTIDAGIGLNIPVYGIMAFPPIIVTLDYALPIGGLPFSVGGAFGIYGSSGENSYVVNAQVGSISFTDSWLFMSFGGRFAYHFNWTIDKLDTYAVTSLGWTVVSYKREVHRGSVLPDDAEARGHVFWGIGIGGRYFFTPNVGIFLELGYSDLSFATLGASFTF
jgi:hypothetical protein